MWLQMVFTILIAVQFLVIVLHDLVDIPGWTHGSQVQVTMGRRKVRLATLANSVLPGIAVAFALYALFRPRPAMAATYWVIYCAVTVLSAIGMWYLPYFFGGSEIQRKQYAAMYAGTRQVLPPRGDNPRPNLLHVCFHILFAMTLVVAGVLWLRVHSV